MKKLLFTARNFRVLMFSVCLAALFWPFTTYPPIFGVSVTGWQYIFGVDGSAGNPILIFFLLIPLAGILLNFLLRSKGRRLVASVLLAIAGIMFLFFLYFALNEYKIRLSSFSSGWCITFLMYVLVLGNCIFTWREYKN